MHAGIPHPPSPGSRPPPPPEQTHPWNRPPRADTPWSRHPPGADTPPPEQTLHSPPPGADTPTPGSRHPPPPPEQTLPPPGETATAADGTHPTGMHSCSFEMLFVFDGSQFCVRILHRQKDACKNCGFYLEMPLFCTSGDVCPDFMAQSSLCDDSCIE